MDENTPVRARRRNFFPHTKQIRFAPVQEHTIQYMVQRFPDQFLSESDYIRKAVTLQARTLLPVQEFEFVMAKGYKDMPVELRDSE